MIRISLQRVAKARNIDNLYSFLMKIGFTHKIATYWSTGKPKRIDLKHLERVCKYMKCEPYDILEWIPDAEDKPFVKNHPLRKMLPKPDVADVKYVLRMLPQDDLDELMAEVEKKRKKLMDPANKIQLFNVRDGRKKRKPNVK
jgi:DNA-binding Xre family transcriptional regulator